MTPEITVIVRAKNSAATIADTLAYLRAETTPVEIIVVDSGSQDSTIAIAGRFDAQVISINPDDFTFGRSLNVGASNVKTPYTAALSSHSVPHEAGWIDLALHYLRNSQVAAVCGGRVDPAGAPLAEGFRQNLDVARAAPDWGFSNTGSFWKTEIWQQFPFDEEIEASEDKEWALRVLAAGYEIAYDPRLTVSSKHRETQGLKQTFRRHIREGRVSARVLGGGPYPLSEAIHHWWSGLPYETPPRMRRRLNPYRAAGIAGLYLGYRTGMSQRVVDTSRVAEFR